MFIQQENNPLLVSVYNKRGPAAIGKTSNCNNLVIDNRRHSASCEAALLLLAVSL